MPDGVGCPSARSPPSTTTASITATPRPGTETKPAATTTEFVAYVLTVAAVLIASALVGGTDGRGDVFLADQTWFCITLPHPSVT